MEKKIIPIVLDDSELLTLKEFCQLASADQERVLEMIEVGILEPTQGVTQESWQFTYIQLRRYQQAQRLHDDLHINLSGVALSLDLLDQLRTLRAKLRALEHQLKLSGQG
jgi:chaperone modulatory protein CbpM